MKTLVNTLVSLLITMVLSCASSKKMDNKLPLEIGDVYYQKFAQDGIKGAIETKLFIPVISNTNNVTLDSVYFQGQQTGLKLQDNIYIGTFTHLNDHKSDIIMSNAPYAEYGNKAPQLPPKRALGRSRVEALVSYNDGNKTNYFKIANITQKEL